MFSDASHIQYNNKEAEKMKEAEKQVCQGRWAGMAVLAGLTFLASSSYAATISGQVTDGTDGLNGVSVQAYKLGKTPDDGPPIASSTTATVGSTDGAYTLTIAEAGDYQLRFSGIPGVNITTEWYEDAPSQDCATPVNVATTAADVADIDAVVEVVAPTEYSSITGDISLISGLAPTDLNVDIYAFLCLNDACDSYDPDTSPSTSLYSIATLDADAYTATYTLSNAVVGKKYKVVFWPYDVGISSAWYGGTAAATAFGSATPVGPVTTTGVTDIDVTLGAGHSISGTVVDSADTLVPSTICIYESNGDVDHLMGGCTDSGSTSYMFTMLPVGGKYKIKATPDSSSTLLAGWHENALTFADATELTIADANLTDKVVTLKTGGSISGLVTDSSDAVLDNVHVCAYQDGVEIKCDDSDTNTTKNYTINGLSAGDYTVKFHDNDQDTSALVDEWYDDAFFEADAAAVTVTVATETKDINAKLEKGGSISGKVTDSAATPVALDGASVKAYVCMDSKCGSMSSYSTESTKADGTYKFGALPSGKYKVKFDEFDVSETKTLAAEWYPEIVTVTAPDETKDINAALDVGGSISGTVTNDGQPLKCAFVWAYGAHWSGDWRGYDRTDYQGKYTVENLSTDLYKVKMSGEGEEYQWYIGKAGHACANKVPVTAPDETTDIDAAFPVTLQQCGGGYYPWINMLL